MSFRITDDGPFKALALTLGTDSAHSAIVGVVARLLRKCGQTVPPISLRPIANELGIDVEWKKSSDENSTGVASLKSSGDRLVVRFHENTIRLNWRRARFTVAHEIIHAVIIRILEKPSLISELDSTPENYQALERLCDTGAAELLMPKPIFRSFLIGHTLSPKKIKELHDLFLVSRDALLRRIAETLPQGCVIRWRKQSRSPGEKSCYRVVASYPGYSSSNDRPWLPKGASMKHLEGFPINESFNPESYFSPIPTKLTINKSCWEGVGYFTKWTNSEHRNVTFHGFPVHDSESYTDDTDYYFIFSEKV